MPEVYASIETTLELTDPITDAVLETVTFTEDVSSSERPVHVERGYHRSGSSSSPRLRSRGAITIRKKAESLRIVEILKRWQLGVHYYPLTADLKGKTYRHPNVRLTLRNADGTVERHTGYGVRLSDRTLTRPDGGLVTDAFVLDVLRGFDLSEAEQADQGEPRRSLDFHRTGTASYLNTSGTFTMASDSQARIGLPWVVRRNLLSWSQDFSRSEWVKSGISILQNQAIAPDGTLSAQKLVEDTSNSHRMLRQTVTMAAGVASCTVYLKAAGRDWAYITSLGRSPTDSASEVTAWFNLATGVVGSISAGGSASITSVGNGWYRCTLSAPATTSPTREFRTAPTFGNNFYVYQGDGSSGIYTWGAQMEPSTTPYQATNASGVDITNPLSGAGLVCEGSATNLLSSNTATATDTSGVTTGFSAQGTGVTLASNTNASVVFQGSRSLSVACDGTSAYQGFKFTPSLTSGKTYTYSLRIYVAAAGEYRIACFTGSGYSQKTISLQAGWNYVYNIYAVTATGFAEVIVDTGPTAKAATFYADTLMLEESPFPTSWVDGTRNADLVGIVPPHNLAKYSEQLDNAFYTPDAAITVTANAVAGPDGLTTAEKIEKTSAVGSRALRATVTASTGGAYTFSVYLKAGTRTKATLRIYNSTKAANAAASTPVTLSSTDWQRFSITTTTLPSAGDSLQLIIYPDDSDTATNTGFIYATGVQLTEGYHSGPYVKTTDTAIPAPVSPALDPRWQRHGRLRFRLLPPPVSTGKNYNLIGYPSRDTSLTAPLRLFRTQSSTSSQHTVFYVRQHNGATGTSSTAGHASIDSGSAQIYDGAPHYVDLEWTEEIRESDGKLELWQRIYVDDVLISEQDVAALFGATQWATIDPSRMISDGNVNAVLGDVIPLWPKPRAGYRPAA